MSKQAARADVSSVATSDRHDLTIRKIYPLTAYKLQIFIFGIKTGVSDSIALYVFVLLSIQQTRINHSLLVRTPKTSKAIEPQPTAKN